LLFNTLFVPTWTITWVYLLSLIRPKDHSLSGTDIKNVNLILTKIWKDEKVLFIRSYKRFFYSNGIIKRDLFAIRDGGLHLNEWVYFSSNWLSSMYYLIGNNKEWSLCLGNILDIPTIMFLYFCFIKWIKVLYKL
jgi:hypothetical protein